MAYFASTFRTVAVSTSASSNVRSCEHSIGIASRLFRYAFCGRPACRCYPMSAVCTRRYRHCKPIRARSESFSISVRSILLRIPQSQPLTLACRRNVIPIETTENRCGTKGGQMHSKTIAVSSFLFPSVICTDFWFVSQTRNRARSP